MSTLYANVTQYCVELIQNNDTLHANVTQYRVELIQNFPIQSPVSKKILTSLVILSMEKTMVTKVNLSLFLDLRFFQKLDPDYSTMCSLASSHIQ